MIGFQELFLLLLILLLIFGGRKLPELARSLGRAKKEFEKSAIEDSIRIRKIAQNWAFRQKVRPMSSSSAKSRHWERFPSNPSPKFIGKKIK